MYAGYHIWANSRLTGLIQALPEDTSRQPLISSFAGLHATLQHMWDAESIWWQRMKMQEHIERPGDHFSGTTAELIVQLSKQSVQWKEWIEQATEAALQHEFIYRNNKKEQFKQPVNEVLLHIFNHGTYHRGQLVTMLRQLGVTNIPATDLVVYLRKK